MKYAMSLAIFFMAIACSGCVTTPSDQFPRETKALDVFLKDNNSGETMNVGRVGEVGGPGHRKAATLECKEIAGDEAKKRRLGDWDYYCCTVTDTSDCASKVTALY